MTKTKKVWVGLLAVILCLGASLGIGLPLGLKDAPQEEKPMQQLSQLTLQSIGAKRVQVMI